MRLGCHKRKLKISICLRFKYQCYNNVGSTNVQISILNWFDWRMGCHKRRLQIPKFDLFDLQILMFKSQCSNVNFQFVQVKMIMSCHKRMLRISMYNLFDLQISMFKYQCFNSHVQISMFNSFDWTWG